MQTRTLSMGRGISGVGVGVCTGFGGLETRNGWTWGLTMYIVHYVSQGAAPPLICCVVDSSPYQQRRTVTDVTVHHLVAMSIMAASIVVAGAYSNMVPWRELLVVVPEGSSGRPQILVVGGGMWAVVDRRGGWATTFVVWQRGTGDSSENS